MLYISISKVLNFDKNDKFFQILKIKNAKIRFSKFEIYMTQSIHGLRLKNVELSISDTTIIGNFHLKTNCKSEN